LVVALWGVPTVHMRGKFIDTKCDVSLFAKHAPLTCVLSWLAVSSLKEVVLVT
jgi:hypothetical protein